MDTAPHGAAEPEQNLLVVGRLGRPHGLKGELTVAVRTDDARGRFVPGAWFLTDPNVGALVLAAARTHTDRWVLRFEDVTSREDAEALRDVTLLVDAAADEPEDDAWPVEDLVGLRAQTPDGHALGTVTALQSGTAQDLLVVDTGAGDVLVPFVTALVPVVDVAAGHVVVDPPGGLFPGLPPEQD
ncbi:ribosome maturation factor RimM [Aquipuribacter sp. MA13-6]|uniref:ribosome maturation factor RimM n=1 Tax=unclassified Aquipuribacter TaxID=2635084 RepID=UPI003EEF1528